MIVEMHPLMGVGFGVFANEPQQITILLGTVGFDIYWGD